MTKPEPLDDTDRVTRVMADIAKVLDHHFADLPDTILILRFGSQCRTLFAATPATLLGEHNPRVTMTEMLEQATVQNRLVNKGLIEKPEQEQKRRRH